jgi:hypothetical protein
MELQLERAIGQASATLEHGHRLVENLFKGHYHPSLCRCGGQGSGQSLSLSPGDTCTANGQEWKAGCCRR